MLRFVNALRLDFPNQMNELNSSLDRDLFKFRGFVEYGLDKIKKYDLAIENTLNYSINELSRIDLANLKSDDKVTIKNIKKKCNNAILWYMKSKELIGIISNYSYKSIYEESDVEKFKNATQMLKITSTENLFGEYIAGKKVQDININIMNLGYDTERHLKIVAKISNEDLGINISSLMTYDVSIERMGEYHISLNAMDSPINQCRAYFIIEVYNERNELISNTIQKEIFFRKEGN